jgi:hypothetical protein
MHGCADSDDATASFARCRRHHQPQPPSRDGLHDKQTHSPAARWVSPASAATAMTSQPLRCVTSRPSDGLPTFKYSTSGALTI